jgi:hypothetical protein
MGFDEGLTITINEMRRNLSILEAKALSRRDGRKSFSKEAYDERA